MAQAVANDVAAIRAMLEVCGISNAVPQGGGDPATVQFLETSGITSFMDMISLKPSDMAKFVKEHNRRPNVAYVTGMAQKNLEVLIYFIKFCWRRQTAILPNNWTADTMDQVRNIMTRVNKKKEEKSDPTLNPGPIDIGGGYRDWLGRFKNKLINTYGAADVPIWYVVRPNGGTPDPNNAIEVDAYMMRLNGPEFEQDNQMVYLLLYGCCNHESAKGRREALTWIESSSATQNGRAAFMAFSSHFEGEGPTTTRKAEAFAQVNSLHWKNETAMAFTTFSSLLKDAYDTIAVDAPYAEEHKVRTMLEKIKPTSEVMRMEVVKGHVRNNLVNNFDGAITYITGQVAEIYAEEIAKVHKYGGKRNRNVYETTTGRSPNAGRGRGGRGGRGRNGRGGRGDNRGRGSGGRNHNVTFNGVDASNIDRKFTDSEWDRMGPAGRNYVNNERARRNEFQVSNRGRASGRGGRYQGNRGAAQGGNDLHHAGRAVHETQVTFADTAVVEPIIEVSPHTTMEARGGRSGSGFGSGAHGNSGNSRN